MTHDREPAGEEPGAVVRRRHVVYVPGYDHRSRRRYGLLFERELARYRRRFDVAFRWLRRPDPDPAGDTQTWSLAWTGPAGTTGTTYEIYFWDDIVARDFDRSLARQMIFLAIGTLHALVTGTLVKFYRLNWKFGNVIIFPSVVIALLALLGGFLAWLALRLALGPLPGLAAFAAVLVGGFATARFGLPWLDRFFVRHLMHDWIFNWRHGSGQRPDYEARVDRFAARLAETIRTSDADELLVIGHSSGALMAVETVARALAAEPSTGRARLSLLTVGSGYPLVVLNPGAGRARAAIGQLAASDRLDWVEYYAPQDWMNFPGIHPARDLPNDVAPDRIRNPVLRSARFRETMSPAAYRSLRMRPYNAHFQFLMGNWAPGEYDFFAIVLGPQMLRDRVRAPQLAGLRPARAPAPSAAVAAGGVSDGSAPA